MLWSNPNYPRLRKNEKPPKQAAAAILLNVGPMPFTTKAATDARRCCRLLTRLLPLGSVQ